MGEALLKGLLSSGIYKSDWILMSDVNPERLNLLSSNYHVKTTIDNKSVLKDSDFIILAVRPDVIGNILNEIKGLLNQRKVIIPIAAGIPTSFISEKVKKKTKIVRVMPNAPALVLMGASVLYFNPLLSNRLRDIWGFF